jgi:hypothetical protein
LDKRFPLLLAQLKEGMQMPGGVTGVDRERAITWALAARHDTESWIWPSVVLQPFMLAKAEVIVRTLLLARQFSLMGFPDALRFPDALPPTIHVPLCQSLQFVTLYSAAP